MQNFDVMSGVKRYIRIILRFASEEAEIREQEFLIKTSVRIFQTCAYSALNIAQTLDVPVLFIMTIYTTSRFFIFHS